MDRSIVESSSYSVIHKNQSISCKKRAKKSGTARHGTAQAIQCTREARISSTVCSTSLNERMEAHNNELLSTDLMTPAYWCKD